MQAVTPLFIYIASSLCLVPAPDGVGTCTLCHFSKGPLSPLPRLQTMTYFQEPLLKLLLMILMKKKKKTLNVVMLTPGSPHTPTAALPW